VIPSDRLAVWYEHRIVGELWRNATGAIGFRYAHDWLESDGFAISCSMPLGSQEFPPETGTAHRWFANLLPEGRVRGQIARDLKLPDSDFALLQAIGGECAGALSIFPVGQLPSENHQYTLLSEEDLSQLIARRGQIYALESPDHRPRLSLAGAQNKCPVLLRDQRYYLPQGEAPSSHILKFELADYRNLPAYETFTTELAKAVGLPVVDITLCGSGRNRFAQVTRYDRHLCHSGTVVRRHQEDFCQALGYGHEQKYQEHGGPSFAQCFRLVQSVSSEPATDALNLIRWQIFNVLAGNSDGHAKNLSLLHVGKTETRLAPFYDLICTRALPRIDVRLAFDIGGNRDPVRITPGNWDMLASACGIQPRFLRAQLRVMRESLEASINPVLEAFSSRYGDYPALQRIVRILRQQLRRTRR